MEKQSDSIEENKQATFFDAYKIPMLKKKDDLKKYLRALQSVKLNNIMMMSLFAIYWQ